MELTNIINVSMKIAEIADQIELLESQIKSTNKAKTALNAVLQSLKDYQSELASQEIKAREENKMKVFWENEKSKKFEEMKPKLLQRVSDFQFLLEKIQNDTEESIKTQENKSNIETMKRLYELINSDFNKFNDTDHALMMLTILRSSHPTLMGGFFRILSYLFEYMNLFVDNINFDQRNESVKSFLIAVKNIKMNKMII